MAYQVNKPLPTDQLSQSQADLLGNFQAIDALITVDHATFNATEEGKHTKVSFISGGVQAFSTGQIGLFNQAAVLPTNRAELWLRRGGSPAYPITAYKGIAPFGPSGGWTYLVSGLIIAWGIGRVLNGTSSIFINYANALAGTNFPGFQAGVSAFYSYPQLTRIETGGLTTSNFVVLDSASNTGFTAKTSTGVITGFMDFSWMVLGLTA
jgi:hypothetical protein